MSASAPKFLDEGDSLGGRASVESFAHLALDLVKLLEQGASPIPYDDLRRSLVRLLYLASLLRADGDPSNSAFATYDRQSIDESRSNMKRLRLLYPDLGYYMYVAAPADILNAAAPAVLMGDLIDDLLDVISELRRGLRLFQCGNADAAVRLWKWSFDVHWEQHLLDFLRYSRPR